MRLNLMMRDFFICWANRGWRVCRKEGCDRRMRKFMPQNVTIGPFVFFLRSVWGWGGSGKKM